MTKYNNKKIIIFIVSDGYMQIIQEQVGYVEERDTPCLSFLSCCCDEIVSQKPL